jgi:O-antigen ligase
MLYPALLPPVMTLLGRKTWPARLGGVLLAVFGVATLILIGQRMPALLGLLGLVAAGLLLPRFRLAVIAAMLAGGVLLASLPVISPPTYQKLVVHFLAQMRHFPESDYGQIYQLAGSMTAGHPVTGFGFDGFRVGCLDPRWTAHPLLPVPQLIAAEGEAEGCALHPHNFWMEAAVTGGLPGLILFAAVAAMWLWRAGYRLNADPLRVGLFAAVLEKLWPIASTNAFYTMPMAGWTFLVVGWALGLAAIAAPEPAPGRDR